MDGILNILKPPGMTSHDVVSFVRKVTGIRKVGHTGTLDPDAAGVLPVCIGRATKAAEYISGSVKKYRAEMKLGIVTETGDSSGKITSQNDWRQFISEDNFNSEIINVLNRFLGKSLQVPPMYSAIKINGKKLYELARKGLEVEREPRNIEIYNISLIDASKEEGTVIFDVVCSKGTYIRTLCEDIGNKLGCGAHMSFLLRTEVSGYKLEDSVTLEELENLSSSQKLDGAMQSVEKVFGYLPKVVITNQEAMNKLMNGIAIGIKKSNDILVENSMVSIYFDGKFVAIANVILKEENVYVKFNKYFG